MKRGKQAFLPLFILFIGASLVFASPSLRAQESQSGQASQDNSNDVSNDRVARLSFTTGEVQYQRPNDDRQSAPANLPIEEGFHLLTANGRAEVQFDSGIIVRLAENSELAFGKLGSENNVRVSELSLIQGSIEVSADSAHDDTFIVDAPGIHVAVPRTARFRMDTSRGDSWASVLKGDIQVSTNSGETRLSSGHTMHIIGANADQSSIELNAPLDDFDRWASSRDQVIEQGYSQALAYVEPYDPDYADYTYGISDLSSYGNWSFMPGYGYCWEPYGVGLGWTPFYFGSWIYSGHHRHWTWVSDEPWGWLPYHTGHWINAGARGWMWQPGSTRTWNPAPVNWLRVGNQIAWAPGGTFNGAGASSAPGIVTGVMDPRGIVIRSGQRIPNAPETIARGATAPTAPAHARRSEPVAPANGTIVFDPAARAYLNNHPVEQPNPANAAATANNSETRTPGSNFVGQPVSQPNHQQRPAYEAPAAHVQQPAPAPRYSPPPQQHYSTPPPAPHYSAPAPPAPHFSAPAASAPSHSGGGGSSGHH
jgi:hypothetical protein